MADATAPSRVSKWWIPQLAIVVWMLPLYAFAAVLALARPAWMTRTTVLLFLQGWLFVYLVFSVVGLLGFYYDGRFLRETNADWQPRWYLYVLASFVLTPSITAPVYLVRRDRRVGIPWSYVRYVAPGGD